MKRFKKLIKRTVIIALLGVCLFLWACTQGPRINEAPLPEGWPELTPVDEIQVKQYPVYRAAVITDEDGGSQSGMFRPLFNHIQRKDIAMTAPVEMTYDGQAQSSMAFLYRTPDMGAPGSDEDDQRVEVMDMQEQTLVSIGVRGSYDDDNYNEALDKLNAWLEANTQWKTNGEPRFLGYNSPFVPSLMRYGEVQIPIVLDVEERDIEIIDADNAE